MAAQSGDPRKRAQKKVKSAPIPVDVSAGPTPASAWVSRVGPEEEDLPLPSGNVARVRRVGPEAFMEQGLMPDAVTPIVEKAIKSKKGLRPSEQLKLAKDPKQLGAAMEMVDRTVVYAVISPKVEMPPACVFEYEEVGPEPGDEICGKLNNHDHPEDHPFQAGERDPDVLYVDRVDIEDKLFIMNVVAGGSRDLERFRREHGAGLAGLSALKSG